MKNILFALCMVSGFIFSSCSTTEKFYLTGQANTEVNFMAGKDARSIVLYPNARAEIKLPSDEYLGYVIAKNPVNGQEVFWGIDVKKKNHAKTKAYLPATVTMGAGALCTAISVGMIGADDDNLVAPMLGFEVVGLAGIVTGAGLIAVAEERLCQLAYFFQFDYEKNQNVDIPQLSTTLANPNPEKGALPEVTSTLLRKKSRTKKSEVSSDGEFGKQKSGSKSSRKIGDAASKVAGEYKGSGALADGNVTEETYSEIVIEIEKTAKDKVRLIVWEGDETFFDEPLECSVRKTQTGWTLVLADGSKHLNVTIDKKGNLRLTHNRVEIDGDFYTLTATGRRK